MKKIFTYFSNRERLIPLGIGVAFLGFVWFAVFGDQGLYQLHKSTKLRKELKQETVELKKKIENLKETKELLNDPSHLELVIRQELGYVKPGEVVFQQMSP